MRKRDEEKLRAHVVEEQTPNTPPRLTVWPPSRPAEQVIAGSVRGRPAPLPRGPDRLVLTANCRHTFLPGISPSPFALTILLWSPPPAVEEAWLSGKDRQG